jgi:two-component system, NarL family, sensor histidine kinase DegS
MDISTIETNELINFKKYRQRYIFAIVSIAITVILSQLLIQFNINTQVNDSRLINISGRQRMLSQQLAKEILILNNLISQTEIKVKIEEVKKIKAFWLKYHGALANGNTALKLPKEKSVEITKFYNEIYPNLHEILYLTNEIILNKETQTESFKTVDLIEDLLNNQATFLIKMNQIVGQYEKEAFEKVTLQKKIEYGILGFTLLILLLELQFIFKPTNHRIELLIDKLLKSQKKALKLAFDTEIIGQQKEDSVKELKSLNYAMENTLLYCRVKPDGEIIHFGEKFAKLIEYNNLNTETKFSKIISRIEKEQQFIDQIILDKQKSGWQGEVNFTTKNGETLWLDMSMTPVSIKKETAELLIICFNITVRKNAEKEVARLYAENIAEKINQQKVISSRIVENQENEQNRIAREIHDGIGQMLTGLKFSLESINLEDKEKSAQKIEYLKKLSLDIIKGVRTATFNLMPPELSDHGIVSSLNKLTQELSRLTGKNISFINKTQFNQRMDSLVEINLYRVTQEAINNAIKYSESSHIVVQLSHSAKLLSVNIDDNGKGFDIKEISKNKSTESSGMGLLFMKERIQYLNGRLFINSIPNEGTRITINVPL